MTNLHASSAQVTGAGAKSGDLKSDNLKNTDTKAVTKPVTNAPPAEAEIPTLQRQFTQFSAIGFALRLPIAATTIRMTTEEFPAWQVESGPALPAFSMRVQMAFATEISTTCEGQANSAIKNLALGGTVVQKISERTLKISGHEARVVWASGTRGAVTNMAGWLLIQTGEGIFISVGIITTLKDFAEVESMLDLSFSSAVVTDIKVAQAARAEMLTRGNALVKAMTPTRLRMIGAAGKPVMHRIWRAMPQGEQQEIGWMETTLRHGTRGDAATGGAKNMRIAADSEEGLLLLVAARMISTDGVTRLETNARYWVAFDQGAEAWSVRSTQRSSGPDVRFSQLGLRSRGAKAEPGTKLIVSTESDGSASEPQDWQIPPTAYLSQTLAFMLGNVLDLGGEKSGEAIFYALDPSTNRLCQRPISWNTAADGAWTLMVQTNPEATVNQERFDARSVRVERIDADGSHTTPSTSEEVRRRWNAMDVEP